MDEQATIGLPSGRPRKDTRALRDHWLKTRVTMDELHRVEQLARDAGKTPSEFFRDAVFNAQIIVKQYLKPDPRIISHLQRIGNNVNQAQRMFNTTGNPDRARNMELFLEEDLRPVLHHLLKLYAP
jgi:hypothetical protein